MFPERLRNLAMLILDDAEQARLKIATAESCTGGLLAALFTEIPGSSNVFERGFVTYSNRAKEEMLGVPGDALADYGAVSEPVARMMAEGALGNSRANIAVGITGVAGPGGGTKMKPVGTVHIACARENRAIIHEHLQLGEISRDAIRMAAVETALNLIQAQMR
ncbi:MAG: CinA family protein [Alphaproteobacteria bacterium]|uniref:CinA family protein n=1 Tax=Hyphomonas sp. TaxID=87 RepID=UPI001DEB5CF7|nr:CinA family protein [Hyphomonas sp.]MBU3920502.1 CinA family protein [Alphaproteobacteria bacterium]MBU4061208.1 CinA family protein [Alphaproteobacteria bacterium]MBU4165120.1 CinA family protein [Alphaproteobacteria bacterium]MBU4568654.1 CinA family protein [Alphaproteobacteria bacterium]